MAWVWLPNDAGPLTNILHGTKCDIMFWSRLPLVTLSFGYGTKYLTPTDNFFKNCQFLYVYIYLLLIFIYLNSGYRLCDVISLSYCVILLESLISLFSFPPSNL